MTKRCISCGVQDSKDRPVGQLKHTWESHANWGPMPKTYLCSVCLGLRKLPLLPAPRWFTKVWDRFELREVRGKAV